MAAKLKKARKVCGATLDTVDGCCLKRPDHDLVPGATEDAIRHDDGAGTSWASLRRKMLDAQSPALADALAALHALVRGECPGLLNEDSGGNSKIAIQVEDALRAAGRRS